jgi:hypothetical protein
MRIDGFASSYPLDRSPRPGTAVTPYREVQREAEQRREQPATPSSTQGFEQTPQMRRVQPANAGREGSGERLPVRAQDFTEQRALSKQALQALASYSSTASFASEADASEVLGLDLYV